VQLQKPPVLAPAKVHPMAVELEGGHTHAQVGLAAHAAGSVMQERVELPPGVPGRKL
jgi:hypothetical protein